jgi:hypothetical protein
MLEQLTLSVRRLTVRVCGAAGLLLASLSGRANIARQRVDDRSASGSRGFGLRCGGDRSGRSGWRGVASETTKTVASPEGPRRRMGIASPVAVQRVPIGWVGSRKGSRRSD